MQVGTGYATWLLFDSLGRAKIALLVLCTLTIYVVTSHLTWRLSQPEIGRKVVVWIGHSWLGRSIGQGLRLLYYAGIPLAVLWRGSLVRQMGIPTTYVGQWDSSTILHVLSLSGAQDVVHLGTGLLVGGGALAALTVVWIWYVRTSPSPQLLQPLVPWWVAVREAALLQLLWAFYRGFAALLTSDGVYVALVSLALIALSWLLSPWRRYYLYTVSRAYAVVQDWMLALFTAFASISGQPLWLLFVVHAVGIWVSGRVLTRLAREGVVRAA